jgi:hypothetical protein
MSERRLQPGNALLARALRFDDLTDLVVFGTRGYAVVDSSARVPPERTE